MVGDAQEYQANSILAIGIPDQRSLSSSLSLQPEEEHAHVFLHQLCGLHLWAGPHHIHHAHLQACPGELHPAASCGCTSKWVRPAWPRSSCILPGKRRFISSLGFDFPVLACTFPFPKLLCPAGAEACLGQGSLFPRAAPQPRALCFLALCNQAPLSTHWLCCRGLWEPIHCGLHRGSQCVHGPLGPSSEHFH